MSSLCDGRWRVLVAFVLWLSPAVVSAESVTLAWDPSADASGYTVRWGTALGSYPNTAAAGSSTSFAITGLIAGATYWTVVQAYNDVGASGFSTPLQFTVPLPAVECTYAISPASVNVSAAAASGAISVTTQAGCAWSAASQSGFLTFQNGTGRTGPGTVGFSVAANPGGLRAGTATVAGKAFTVSQAAGICTYAVSPSSISISAAAASGTIAVTTQAGCAWNAITLSDFVAFQNGTGRSGSGTVGYTAEANSSSNARTGIAAVGATTVYVMQAGAVGDSPPPVASPWSSDFDGDGRNDLLVHDSIGGSVEAWFLNGATVKGTQPISHSRDLNWIVAGRGDFNADGKPDLVWQHTTDGSIYLAHMDGTVEIGGASPSSQAVDPRWHVVGVGDFNRDGQPDLVWQHSADGALAVWYMSGATVTGTVNVVPNKVADLLWKVVGAADFNGDGTTDLLWRHMGNGDVAVWLMNGVTRIIHSPLNPWRVPDQRWQVGAVTDANGDGKPDLVWGHTDGTIMIWHMNGTSRGTYPVVSATVPLGWQIVGPK